MSIDEIDEKALQAACAEWKRQNKLLFTRRQKVECVIQAYLDTLCNGKPDQPDECRAAYERWQDDPKTDWPIYTPIQPDLVWAAWKTAWNRAPKRANVIGCELRPTKPPCISLDIIYHMAFRANSDAIRDRLSGEKTIEAISKAVLDEAKRQGAVFEYE